MAVRLALTALVTLVAAGACASHDEEAAAKPAPSGPYCYRTLADVDCYAEPQPVGEGQLIRADDTTPQ